MAGPLFYMIFCMRQKKRSYHAFFAAYRLGKGGIVMSELVLSIGMIVKNESRSLEQCLKALSLLREYIPCELIIADTGSTDNTKEIAGKYADVVFDFPWVDDFAAARNAVIDRCHGTWYLSVDADEYLDENIEELVAFLKDHADNSNLQGAFIQIHNYISADLDKSNVNSFMVPRMVRISSGIRYEGKIHEHLNIPWDDRSAKLYNTSLWHDGYVYVGPRDWHKKAKRNLALLKQEIREQPERGMLYVQLVESSEDLQARMKEIRKSFVLKKLNKAQWEAIAPAIYCHGVKTAVRLIPKEDPEYWAKKSYKEFPDSPFTLIDVTYTMTLYYAKQEKWEEVYTLSQRYLSSVERLNCGEFGLEASRGSVLGHGNKLSQIVVTLYCTQACYELDRYDEAVKKLDTIQIDTLPAKQAEGYLSVLLKLGRKIDIADMLKAVTDCILEKEPDSALAWDRRQYMRAAIEKAFQAGWNSDDEEERPAYHLIALFGDSVYTPCANIMLTEEQEKINHNLELITDWKRVPPAVFVRLMELEIAVPEAFFVQATLDRIISIVKSLPSLMDDFEEKSYQYAVCCPQDASIGQLTWSVNLILEVCMIHDWRKHDEFGITLYQSCCHIMKQFLETYYCPQMLENADYARVLPEPQMAGWYLVQAEQARGNDDLRSFARILKEMVHKLPAWKKMIGFLGEYYAPASEPLELDKDALQEKDDAVSKELLALAQQIKTILAQFPANHPSVKALKMSDAYQKVAKLIEEMD